MATEINEEVYLSHSGQEVDDACERSITNALAISAVEDEISSIILDGAKNHLPDANSVDVIGAASSEISYSVDNGIVTIVASEELTGTAAVRWTTHVKSGRYTFSANSDSSTAGLFDAFIDNVDVSPVQTVCRDNSESPGNTASFESGYTYRVTLRVKAGFSGSVSFAPMLRYPSIKDTTYTQYAPTNKELYEMIRNIIDDANNVSNSRSAIKDEEDAG